MLYAFSILPKFDTLALAHVCLSATSFPSHFHVVTYRDETLETGYVSVAVLPEHLWENNCLASVQHEFFKLNEELVKLFRRQENDDFTVLYGACPFRHDERISDPTLMCEMITMTFMRMSEF